MPSQQESYWNLAFPKEGLEFLTKTPLSPLTQDMNTEVCIVGAGITGLTTAYHMLLAGKKVCILDAQSPTQGESFRTSAHLTYVLDKRFIELAHIHGQETVKNITRHHAKAIDFIENLVREHSIQCDFKRVDGYLLASKNFTELDLAYEFEFLLDCDFPDVRFTNTNSLPGFPMSGLDNTPCILFPNQAQFNPRKYLMALTEIVTSMGGRIYFNTLVSDLKSSDEQVSLYTTSGNTVSAEKVVLAGDAPIANKLSLSHKVTAYRTYVIAGKVLSGTTPEALFWDTEDPYHYVRLDRTEGQDYDILLIGGADHRTGQAQANEDYFLDLEYWARSHFPRLEAVEYHWSGQIMEPIDSVAYIGHEPSLGNNIFVATGYSGNGLTYGTMAGSILKDLLMGNETLISKIYDPKRMRVAATSTNLTQNLNTALQYRDWITSGDGNEAMGMDYEEGCVFRDGLKKIAVYRDKNGQIYAFNATCTHLGGIVRWNDVEQTWDCPCHGSRFDRYGKVIHGPATHCLKPIDTEETKLLRSLAKQNGKHKPTEREFEGHP